MKKLVLIFGVLVLLLGCSSAFAMGPLMVEGHRVVCDRNVEADMAGYYVYWRVAGQTAWLNSQRSPQIPQPPVGQMGCQYDLLNFALPNGNYEIVATAADTAGNESGPSNIVPFSVDIPAAPGNLNKQ